MTNEIIIINDVTYTLDIVTGKLTMCRIIGEFRTCKTLSKDIRSNPKAVEVEKRELEKKLVDLFGLDLIIKEATQDMVHKSKHEGVLSYHAALEADFKQEIIRLRNRSIWSILWRKIVGWSH